MTRPPDSGRPPSLQEVADLTGRLRALTGPGARTDPVLREGFLADKDALLARIPGYQSTPQDTTAYDERSRRGTEQIRGEMQEDDMSSNNDTTNSNTEVGLVPRFGAQPGASRYETMDRDEAVEQVARVGFDRADAAAMVDEYVVEATTTHGEPTGGLVIDPYDLAEITARYESANDNASVDATSPDGLEAARLAGALLSEAKHTTDPTERAALTEHATRAAQYAAREAARAATEATGPWQAIDDEGRVVATFDPVDAYSAAEITAITDAYARGDHDEADRLQAARQPLAAVSDVWGDDLSPTAEQIGHDRHVMDVSWAVAARDAAIERSDTTAAARFAHEARAALDAAEQAGIGRAQLASELDYPGGAAELDGEHIDHSIHTELISAAELARRDAEFDALCERHPLPGDPAAVEIGADGQAYWPDTHNAQDEADQPRERSRAEPMGDGGDAVAGRHVHSAVLNRTGGQAAEDGGFPDTFARFVDADAEQEQRSEQLNRWHDDGPTDAQQDEDAQEWDR